MTRRLRLYHLFYAARHVIDSHGLQTRCGFVHVPLCSEQSI